MFAYIASHMGYIVITLILVLIVTAIIARIVKDKKAGKSGCGCGCESCASAPYCHPAPPPKH